MARWQARAGLIGFVSYGAVAAGTRAVQMLKPVLVLLKMTPVAEAVNIPFTGHLLNTRQFDATESLERAAQAMLVETQRLEEALRPLRIAARQPLFART
ncbi:MAG: hypothetical protein ACR2IK_01305 [Chloroflexota bacterium]